MGICAVEISTAENPIPSGYGAAVLKIVKLIDKISTSLKIIELRNEKRLRSRTRS